MPTRARLSRVARAAIAVAAAVALVTACATGERPSFDTSPGATLTTPEDGTVPPSGDLQAFLARLERPAIKAETLVYKVKANFQGIEDEVTVTRDPDRTLVAVRDVQFRDGKGRQETCLRATHACTSGWESQRLSDLAITPDFWGPAMYRRLAGPAPDTRIDQITSFTGSSAGQPVVCIDVPGPGHTDRYCTVDTGAIAALDLVDVHVELVSYQPAFADSLWAEFPGG